MGLECTVFYMVRVSYNQKPYSHIMIETYGAEVHASPTDLTQAGCDILEEHPDSPGSLGIASSEAVEDAVRNEDATYEQYLAGELVDLEHSEEDIERAVASIPD
jgi:tryptophan synthase beta chain